MEQTHEACSDSQMLIIALGGLTDLNGKAEHLYAHPAHVRSCHLPHQFSKLVPVLIDLLDSQGACRDKALSLKFTHTNQSHNVFLWT